MTTQTNGSRRDLDPTSIGLPLEECWPVYLSYGWRLLPLAPGGKPPYFDLLRECYGTTRIEHLKLVPAIREESEWWFLNWPDINLGVFPGNGLVLVDIDHLDLLNPDLPTPTASSGRDGGGKHMYFTSDQEIAMTKHEWGHVNPAYLVLPGSLHPTGRRYQWLPGLSPLDVPFMPFEDALAHLDLELGRS